MVNKALRIVLYTIFTISLLFVVPFNNIYADTITSSNINGISITLDEVTFIEYKQFTIDGVNTNVARNYYSYIAEIQFDKSYLGNININMQYSYQARNDTGMVTFNGTKLQKVFVNGDKAYMSFGFVANSNTDPFWYNSVTYSLTNSDVIEYGLISDIQQILDILQENQDIIDDIYSELQNVVTNTTLANDYMEILTEMRQYNFPIESFNYLYQFFYLFNYDPIDLINYNYWTYPIYEVKNKEIARVYLSTSSSFNDYIFIFGLANQSISGSSQLSNIMSFSSETTDVSNISFNSFKRLYVGTFFSIYSVVIHYSSGSAGQTSIMANNNYGFSAFLPIYLNKADNKYLSTDFALQYGLSNDLLDNIKLIANGTNASSAASSQSDLANTQLQQDSSTLFSQEDSFKQNMNSAMQNIDTTFTLGNFGSNFMTSAQWVRTQYETLTNNTPFASLITFSLLVGLALIVIGKVYK